MTVRSVSFRRTAMWVPAELTIVCRKALTFADRAFLNLPGGGVG